MEEKEIKENLERRFNEFQNIKTKAEGAMEGIMVILQDIQRENDDKKKKKESGKDTKDAT